MASKNAKQVENIVKELGRTGKNLEKALGLFETAVAAETKAAAASNKIVNDKFKTLTKTLGLQKESNEYHKAANNIQKTLETKAKSLTNEEKKQLELHKKQLNVMGKLDGIHKDITEQFGMQTSALKNGVKQARLLLNPIIALSGFLALSVKRFFELEALGKGTARASGLLESNTREFQRAIKEIQPELIAFGASIDDISKASTTVADNFGFLDTETAEIVKDAVQIGTAFGLQAETMASVVSQARLLGASMEDIDNFTIDVINSGLQVNKVFEDLSKISGDTGVILAGNTKQLMNQVLEARRLGLNLNDIANTQSISSGFQGMFQDQMKASVLFGRSINLVESNRLKMQGKFVEASEMNLAMITGSVDPLKQIQAIENMGFFQKKELEKIEGRTADQIIKDKRRQAFLAGKLTGEDRTQVESEIAKEKALQRQLNIQDKLRAIFTRLGIVLGEKLLPYIEEFAGYLEEFVSNPTQMTNALNKIGDAITNVAIAFGLFKGAMFGGQVAQLFGAFQGGAPGVKKFQNLFAGTEGRASLLGGRGQKRTMSGALNRSAGRMNAIGGGAAMARVLGPAAAILALGTDVFKLVNANSQREKRQAQGGIGGSLIGGGIGFLLGGPMGAAIGAGLGQLAGKAVAKYFETEEEKLGRAARTATANIQREIAMSVRAKRNDITQSLTDAFKGISFDQVAERLGKSLGVDEKTSQALIKQTGMTAEKFKTLDDKGLGVFVQSLIDASGVVDTYSKNLQSLSDQAAQEAGIEEAKAVVSMVQGIKKDLGGEDEASQRQIVEAFIKSQDTNLFNKLRKRDDFDTMSADKLMNFFETSMEKGAFKGQTGQKAEEIMIEQGQAFFKELLTQQLGADTFQKLAGGDIDKFIEDNVTGFAMRGFQSFGDYEEEHLGKTTSKLVDKLLNQAMMEQNRKSVEARRIFQEKKMEEERAERLKNMPGGGDAMTTPMPIQNDFTLRSHPADTLMVQGGTQIGNDVVEKLDAVIDAIKGMGGDVYMDGKKVGRRIAESQ